MSLPDHPVWRELEGYFRKSIQSDDRQLIVQLVQEALRQDPNVDLEELTFRVTQAVLKRVG